MADYARAERLRDLRDATHLSREKVAGEIGVTTKTLYAWENGGSIRWENAKKLAGFYGVDAESLVSRDLSEAVESSNGSIDGVSEDSIQGSLNQITHRLNHLETGQEEIITRLERVEASLTALSEAVQVLLAQPVPVPQTARAATRRSA